MGMALLFEEHRGLIVAHQDWRNVRDARIGSGNDATERGLWHLLEQRIHFFLEALLRNRFPPVD